MARVDGLAIHYETKGSRAPALCLVHGTGGSAGVWQRQVEGVADLVRVVALSRASSTRSRYRQGTEALRSWRAR